MPVKAAATAADSEDIATIPSGSPMPSESPDAISHSDNTSSSNLTSDSTVSLKSNNSEPTDQGEINDAADQMENNPSSTVENTVPTDIVTPSHSQHTQLQLEAGGDEKLLQMDVGGAPVTQWPAAMPTTVSTSQLPSQYFKMSSNISTTSDTDQTLAAPEQQDELSSSLSSLNSQLSQQQMTSEGLQQLNIGVEPVSNASTTSSLPTDTVTITTTSATAAYATTTTANITTTTSTTNAAAGGGDGDGPLPSQVDASCRLRSTSLPSINLAAAIEDKTPRAYRVGSLTNVMLRKQGDGLESNLPVVMTAPAVTSQSFDVVDQSRSTSTVVATDSSVPMDDRPLLLDGENRSDGSDQAVGGARTDVSNVLEREGPLVGADSDEEGDENSVSSSTPSESNFLLDDRPYSLLDHQLQFSMFEPSNLEAIMARESLLSSLRPPVTAGQEKTTDINPSLTEAIQVTVVSTQSLDVFTTLSSSVTNTRPFIVTTDNAAVTAAVAGMMKQDVSVTRSDFLHGTSKLSEVERPTAVGFTEWDKAPVVTMTTPSHSEADVIVSSSDVMKVTSSGDILPYLEPQGIMDSEESDSISTTDPTMDFGNSLDGIELPQGAADDFGKVKDANSFLKELEQDELLVEQQNGTPKVRMRVTIVFYCIIHYRSLLLVH